jgi:hypothetical protein
MKPQLMAVMYTVGTATAFSCFSVYNPLKQGPLMTPANTAITVVAI